MHDLVIKGGTVVDGTGEKPRRADVAIDGGRITRVGAFDADADADAGEVIDATGMVVTPGFVNIHCHYDGQATWDPLLEPSSLHGITTVVMGNCGVGFAPVQPDRHEWLIELMEGVEDIPGTALAEGISWGWESFPEYLDVLDSIPRAIDVGAQLPHGALRGYVMGERGAANEPATDDDIARMAELVRDAMHAGALGFSTNRLERHRSKSGVPVPGTFADERELTAIIGGMAKAGVGTVEWIGPSGFGGCPTPPSAWADSLMMRRLAESWGVPIIFQVNQLHGNPDGWRREIRLVEEMAGAGFAAYPQVHGRGFCILFGWDTSVHPFIHLPSWQPLATLPYTERLERLMEPAVRTQLVSEAIAAGDLTNGFLQLEMVFSLGEPPSYEPQRTESVLAIAEQEGRSVYEVMYDEMLGNDGRNLLSFQIMNYADYNLDVIGELLSDPLTVLGGADGGAHCATVSDASMPSFMLTHWARDRRTGRLPLEVIVRKMTANTAAVYGLSDRGVLAPGMKADVNVIDLERLQLHLPEMRYDLPAGGKRLVQQADGYVATVVAGQVIRRHGIDTGARPGHLVRSF